jgi:hypothetical protein
MTDLTLVPHAPIRANERVIAAADLAELRRNPRVIDGEVTGSWFPRPMWPALTTSSVLLAIGVVSLLQEVVR